MSDVVRLRVDKATREVLEQLTDQLDNEPRWAAELRADVSGRIASESDASREQDRHLAERVGELAGNVKALSDSLSQSLAEVVQRLEDGRNAVGRQAETAEEGMQALLTQVTAIRGELGDIGHRMGVVECCLTSVCSGKAEGFSEVRETLANLTSIAAQQQAQLEALSSALQRLSRPWWQKIFGT